MQKNRANVLCNVTNSSIFQGLIAFLIFIFWLIPYILINQNNTELAIFFENAGLIVMGLSCLFVLVFSSRTSTVLEIMLLVPFMFAHQMSVNSVPIMLYVVVVLLVIGIIINYIIYKPKITYGSFTVGLALLCLSLPFGGLFVENERFVFNLFYMLFIGIVFIIGYLYLTSTTKGENADKLAVFMTYLGIILMLQMITFVILNGGISESFDMKKLQVGWGITNNIAMILLFTFPFSFYLANKSKSINKILFMILGYLQCFAIVLNYSRGAIMAMLLCLPLCIIYSILSSKNKRTDTLINIGILMIIISVFLIIFRYDRQAIDTVFQNITNINMDTLNGRKEIYIKLYNEFLNHPLFGYGLLGNYNFQDGTYLWGHNTFIQVGYSLGIVGLVALIIHYIEKYFCFIFSKENNLKWVVLISFVGTDIYGLMDVSYFFINFMIVLLVVLILSENINPERIWTLKKKSISEGV